MNVHHNKKTTVILASKSPRRKRLLREAGLDFKIIESGFDEDSASFTTPEDYTVTLATGKASEISRKHPDAWVIGADTIVVLDGEVMEKPGSEAEAEAMLGKLSGNVHHVYTGYAILCRKRDKKITGFEKTSVLFKKLSKEEIECYIKTREPFDKAGGYAIQGAGAAMVKSINGSYTNVVGLPLCEVAGVLLREGIMTHRNSCYGNVSYCNRNYYNEG